MEKGRNTRISIQEASLGGTMNVHTLWRNVSRGNLAESLW